MWYLIVSIPDLCNLTYFHSQTQNKAQRLAACGHVSASSQSLRFILSLRLYSSFITPRPGLKLLVKCITDSSKLAVLVIVVAFGRFLPIFFSLKEMASIFGAKCQLPFLIIKCICYSVGGDIFTSSNFKLFSTLFMHVKNHFT